MEFPHLEIYLREKSSFEGGYRFIFDKGDFEDDPDAGKIVYYQPDLSNSEYIGALMRIEESNLLDVGEERRYLFVYADIRGMSTLLLGDSHSNQNMYLDIINESDHEVFISKINNLIHENKDEDIIAGNTVNILDQN